MAPTRQSNIFHPFSKQLAVTDLLYFRDCYVREWSAVVEDTRSKGVVLDRTAFYPQGGGQPSDTGTVTMLDGRSSRVLKVIKDSGDVLHILEGAIPEVGERVECTLDWPRRYGHMRYHTAQHLLSAYFLSEYNACTSGNQISAGKGSIDFQIAALDGQMVQGAEAQLAAWVDMSLPVKITMMPREAALRTLDPKRTRVDLLPRSVKTLRIVEISGVDAVACAGTHVGNTSEVGTLKVTGTSSGGKGRRRLEFLLV